MNLSKLNRFGRYMYVMLVGFLVLNTYHARVRYRFDKMTGLTKWYKLRRKGGGFTTQIQSLICGRPIASGGSKFKLREVCTSRCVLM